MEHGKIDIELDELTPCLRRISDGAVVRTKSYRLKSLPKSENFSLWEFDWRLPFADGLEVYALKAEGDARIQGMISLRDQPEDALVFIENAEASPFNSKHNRKIAGKEYAGVGAHLFTLACLVSYHKGYGGFVSMIAKTKLVQYYHEVLGAVQVGSSSRMFIDERAARKLVTMYYGNAGT